MRALTSVQVAASEAVGFFAVAESVDEGAQLPHVPHPPCHHHLLLDDVGLGKVRPSLWRANTNESPSRSVCAGITAHGTGMRCHSSPAEASMPATPAEDVTCASP